MRITKIPKTERISKDFQIKLNGEEAQAYAARVSAMPFNREWPGHQRDLSQTEEASFLTFTMDGPVEVELTASKDFSDLVIRPLSDSIQATVQGRKIRFTVSYPGQYTVELDGWHNALHIFASPEVDFGVTPETENVIYFGPGVHTPGVIEVGDNYTVYIDRDAVVYGSILGIGATNVKILGYGILDGSREDRGDHSMLVPKDLSRRNPGNNVFSAGVKEMSDVANARALIKPTSVLKDKASYKTFLEKHRALSSCIHLYGCADCLIRGVVMRDAPGFTVIAANCEALHIDDVKLIGMWRYNSDGIDFFNSRRCTVKNSFLRNFDDCIVIKGIPGWDEWNNEDILVENCVVWCDWGANLEIGAETVADEYKNIIFRDCDCIHNTFVPMRIHNCDRAHVHDVLYENICVEYSKYDELPIYQASEEMQYTKSLGFRVPIQILFEGEDVYFSNDRVKGRVSDIHYKNILILTDSHTDDFSIRLEGYGKEHDILDVTLESITLNGKQVDLRKRIATNEFVENITVK